MMDSAKRILIVDDEKPIREVLSAALKDDGYLVETAFDGESGLEMMTSITIITSHHLIISPGS